MFSSAWGRKAKLFAIFSVLRRQGAKTCPFTMFPDACEQKAVHFAMFCAFCAEQFANQSIWVKLLDDPMHCNSGILGQLLQGYSFCRWLCAWGQPWFATELIQGCSDRGLAVWTALVCHYCYILHVWTTLATFRWLSLHYFAEMFDTYDNPTTTIHEIHCQEVWHQRLQLLPFICAQKLAVSALWSHCRM